MDYVHNSVYTWQIFQPLAVLIKIVVTVFTIKQVVLLTFFFPSFYDGCMLCLYAFER